MLTADAVRSWITEFLANLTGVEAADIRGDAPFHTLGLDSVDAVVAAGMLEEQFGTEIEATLFLRNATIDAVLADLKTLGIVA